MASCVFCDGEIPDGGTVCPHCGRKQGRPGEARHQWVRIAIFAMLLIVVMVVWSKMTGLSVRPD